MMQVDPKPGGAPSKLPARVRLTWIAVAVAVTGIAVWKSAADHVAPRNTLHMPAGPASGASASASPSGVTAWVVGDDLTPSVHGSSVCALPDGGLATVWYGGEREGAPDVAIYWSRRSAVPGSQWSPPQRLLGPEEVEADIGRNVRKLGNAVLFPDQTGRLWLVYVSVSVGGWSGSVLNVRRSDDDGRSWSLSQRLTLSPLLNFSTLVRAKPFFTADGWIGLPVYHEFVAKYPQILWLEPGADQPVSRFHLRRLPVVPDLLQPTVVPLDEQRALMLLRDSGSGRSLHAAHSNDAGWNWTKPAPTELPNPDSGIDAIRLHDGRIVLAFNDARDDRRRLRLAISHDEGETWSTGVVLEDADQGEFSYPSLAQDHQGMLHVTYTWQRRRIKHVQFHTDQLTPTAGRIASRP